MATIVRQYDPWREKAAVNLISGLISGLLQRNWQNEDNRKMNAFRGEVLSELDRRRGATPQLQGQQTLGDYSGNTWARASQPITDSALSQFDALAEEDNLPKYDISKTGAVPIQSLQSPITIQDMQDAIARTLAAQPRRWARLSDQAIQAEFLPYMQAMEQGRQEQLRNNLADSYGQAQDAAAKRDVLMRGAISGFIPESMAAQGQKMYEYDNPNAQPYSFNTGDKTLYGGFNPRTGEYTQQGSYTNNLTPQQVADNRYRNRALAQSDRQFNATLGEQRRQFNEGQTYNRETRDMNREDANQPRYGAPYAGSDGKLYQNDQFGNPRPFIVGGVHMDAPENIPQNVEWNKGDDAYVENINNEIKSLQEKRKGLEDEVSTASKGDKVAITKSIEAIDEQISQERQKISSYITGKKSSRTSQRAAQRSLGSLMIGNANAGRITGRFGTDRGDHSHAGTDYPAPEGTPIKIRPEMGNNLKVVHVNTNPSASTYGNNVQLEGNIGGHKVKFIMAHMKTGSIKVKAGDVVNVGDVIGGVGSTGRSSGNHLHFEVIVDGQKVDPEKFLAEYVDASDSSGQGNAQTAGSVVEVQPTQSAPSTASQPANTGQAPEVAATPDTNSTASPDVQPQSSAAAQNTPKDNSPTAWTHPNGDVVTENEDAMFRQRVKNGQVSDLHSDEDVDRYYEGQGYKRAEKASPTASYSQLPPYVTGNAVTNNAAPANNTREEIVNHATSADVQAGVNKLNGVEELTSWGVYPVGFLASRV